jgi:hypothetical protein
MDFDRSFSQTSVSPAMILPLNPDGSGIKDQLELGMFYINPASWTESKTSHWAKHEVPGYSDPHQQWISGGVRQITFEALVTRDRTNGNYLADLTAAAEPPTKDKIPLKKRVMNAIGGIALTLFPLPLSLKSQLNNATDKSSLILDLDISTKLNYYRSFLYPRMVGQTVVSPPPLIKLICGTTFGLRIKHSKFVLDKLDIKITKQLANLAPSEAIVTFTLTELPGRNISYEKTIKDS